MKHGDTSKSYQLNKMTGTKYVAYNENSQTKEEKEINHGEDKINNSEKEKTTKESYHINYFYLPFSLLVVNSKNFLIMFIKILFSII